MPLKTAYTHNRATFGPERVRFAVFKEVTDLSKRRITGDPHMTEDIHEFKQVLETALENIQNSPTVREENKQLAEDFKNWNALRSASYSRQYRYLSSLKQIIEYNDFRLDDLEDDQDSKRKIHTVLGQIENSAYKGVH